MGSNVRSVTVRLDAMVAEYSRKMRKAGDDTEKAFSRIQSSTTKAREDFIATQRAADQLATSTSKLNTTTRLTSPSQQRLATDVDRVSVAAVRGSASIDRYSGRLRILGELLATLGPGLIPFGAGGVAALGALAGVFGAATVGALALVGATQGVGDALKAVEEARLDPTVENLQAAEQAMSRIAPDAREFVTRFQELRPVLKAIRDAGAEEFFPGVTESLDSFERMAPLLERLSASAGRAGGDAIARGADSLASDRWEPFLDFLVDEIPEAIDNTTRLIGSLSHAGAEMWMTFDPTNDRFIDWLVDVSDKLDDWSSSSEGQEQIREFLAYAEKTGPKVLDFFVATVDAVTQLVQAASPLSGPVLESLTLVTKLVAEVADSDLGTPILAGVAALALYNRALSVTAALQTKLTGSTALSGALAGGGIVGATRAGGAGVKQLGRDLREYAALRTQVLARTTAETERMNAAMARSKPALTGLAKGGAALGGLAVASTGLADSMGMTNTASLALLGTLGGPWGAAAGAVAGSLMDIAAANDAVVASYEQTMAAVGSGDLAGAQANLAQLQRDQAAFTDQAKMDAEDWLQVVSGIGVFLNGAELKNGIEGLFGTSDVDEGANRIKEAQKAVEELQASADRLADTEERVAAQDRLREWARSSVDSFHSLSSAIERPTLSLDQLQERMRAIGRANAEMGRSIQQALENGADADAIQRVIDDLGPQAGAALKELAAGGEAAARRFNRAFGVMEAGSSRAATAIGEVGQAVIKLPDGRTIRINVQTNDSMTQVARLQAAIAAVRGKTVTIRTITQATNLQKRADVADAHPADGGTIPWGGGRPIRSAEGSTVPKDGGPYADRYPYLLAPGEEVISNRHGQADRWRPLLKAINAGRLADGGTAGRDKSFQTIHTTATLNTAAQQEANLVGRSLKELRRQLKLSEKAVEEERKQRDDLISARDNLVSGVRSGLDKGIWKPNSGGSVWAEGSGDPIAHERAQIAEIDQFDALTGRLKKVLSGPAFDAILAEGDLATARAYAGMTDDQLREFQQLYGVKQQRLNDVSGMVGDARYGAEIAAQTKELKGANRRLERIENAIDRSTKSNSAEQSATRDESRKGAGKAAKSKNFGQVPKFVMGR